MIGTGFRFKGSIFDHDSQSLLFDQMVQYMVMQIPKPVFTNLDMDMTIAEVVRDTGERLRVGAVYRRDGFRRGCNRYHVTRWVTEAVAIAKPGAALKHDADIFAGVQLCAKPTALAQFERQLQHCIRFTNVVGQQMSESAHARTESIVVP